MNKSSLFAAATFLIGSTVFAADCQTLTAQTQQLYTNTLVEMGKSMDSITSSVDQVNCATVRNFLNTDSAAISAQMDLLKTELENLKPVCPKATIFDEDEGKMTIDKTLQDVGGGQIILDMYEGTLKAIAEDCQKAGF